MKKQFKKRFRFETSNDFQIHSSEENKNQKTWKVNFPELLRFCPRPTGFPAGGYGSIFAWHFHAP